MVCAYYSTILPSFHDKKKLAADNLSASTHSLVLLGVVEGGVRELAIVVLRVEAGADGVGNSEEVLQEKRVRVVHVEVVLEVLEHVHVLLDELVASDSGEGESLVVELPGVHVDLGVLAVLEEVSLDVLSVGPVSGVEGSGEHVNLVVELGLGLIEIDAGSLELHEIDDTIVLIGNDGVSLEGLDGGDGGLGGLDLGGDAEEGGKSDILHYRSKRQEVRIISS
jgi:hypothetical protein